MSVVAVGVQSGSKGPIMVARDPAGGWDGVISSKSISTSIDAGIGAAVTVAVLGTWIDTVVAAAAATVVVIGVDAAGTGIDAVAACTGIGAVADAVADTGIGPVADAGIGAAGSSDGFLADIGPVVAVLVLRA